MNTSLHRFRLVAAGLGLTLAVLAAPAHVGAMDMTGMRPMMTGSSSGTAVPSQIAAIEARVHAQLAALGLGLRP